MATRKADLLKLRFSTSDGHPGRVTNVEWTWPELVERLRRPTKDSFTLAQFKALSETTQLKRKNNGYFVGGQFKHGIRKNVLMRDRYLLTFDIDQATPDLLADLELGATGLGDLEYVVYSTRKHSAASPRVRMVFPLSAPLDKDKFEPLSRILAQKLDAEMMVVDRVSFVEAQFMYWPSVCRGEDFYFLHNKGKLIRADRELNAFGDWQNYANLPRSPRENALRKADEKAPDPRLKTNVIGAFCRVNSIHDCIEKYLNDTYTVSERDQDGLPTRYSYTHGTTANGVVVYDDGQYLYSHHGTDPVGGRLVNAFDLRRVHEFGELDEKAEEDTPVNKLKSFVAMTEALGEDREVISEMLLSNYSDDDSGWDDVEDDNEGLDSDFNLGIENSDNLGPELNYPPGKTPKARKAKPGTLPTPTNGQTALRDAAARLAWREALDVTTNGIIKSTLPNLVILLQNAPHFKDRFAYDDFMQESVVLRDIRSKGLDVCAPGRSETDPIGRLSKLHLSVARTLLESPAGTDKPGWGLKVADRDLAEAHSIVSSRRVVHPIRDWLATLAWDGKPRLHLLWVKACHTPDTAYYHQTAVMWMTAAVCRVHEPGHKFDFAPIIEGRQGLYKSSLLKIIGGRWTGETEGHFDDKARFVESTQGFWIVEIPELVQFQKSEVEDIKACLSRQEDRVRLAYAPFPLTYKRQHVMAGTTNQTNYLKDKTGNRRFWPIPCDNARQINLGWVQRYRDQLWAEAMHTYQTMRATQPDGPLPLYLSDPAAAAMALELQGKRVVSEGTYDVAGMIGVFLDKPVRADLASPGSELGDACDSMADDIPTVRRTMTCGMELWERVMGGKISDYNQSRAAAIRHAMQEVGGWSTADATIMCGRYGRQRVYTRL